MKSMQDRLFVPLKTKPFESFKSREKRYEVRAYGRGFTERFVTHGRDVELRKGYSGESLRGKIGMVLTGQLEDILHFVDFKQIDPGAQTREETIAYCRSILGEHERYIVFEVMQEGSISGSWRTGSSRSQR